MLSKISMNAVAIVFAFGLTGAPIVAQAVCIDEPCPHPSPTHSNTVGAYSLENNTGVAILYLVKWGNEQWTTETLNTGQKKTYSHFLNEDGTAPTPLVRFDELREMVPQLRPKNIQWTYISLYQVNSPRSTSSYLRPTANT